VRCLGTAKVDAANQMKLVGLNIMGIFKFRIHCVRLRRLARDSSGAYLGKRSSRPYQNLTVRRKTENSLKIESLGPASPLRFQQRRICAKIIFEAWSDPATGQANAIPSLMVRSTSGGWLTFRRGIKN
jgi:hypothetical protein